MIRVIDRLERAIGVIALVAAAVLIPVLLVVRNFEIASRMGWNLPGSLFNAMEREAFLLLILLIIGGGYVAGAHVRVDVVRERLSSKAKAWLEIIGGVLCILPLAFIALWFGWDMIASAVSHGERAALFFGAPYRWVIVAALPFGITLLAVAVLCRVARCWLFLRGQAGDPFR